jgi:hypothetical protein
MISEHCRHIIKYEAIGGYFEVLIMPMEEMGPMQALFQLHQADADRRGLSSEEAGKLPIFPVESMEAVNAMQLKMYIAMGAALSVVFSFHQRVLFGL